MEVVLLLLLPFPIKSGLNISRERRDLIKSSHELANRAASRLNRDILHTPIYLTRLPHHAYQTTRHKAGVGIANVEMSGKVGQKVQEKSAT